MRLTRSVAVWVYYSVPRSVFSIWQNPEKAAEFWKRTGKRQQLFLKEKQYIQSHGTFAYSVRIVPFQRDYEQVSITACSRDIICTKPYFDFI